MKNVGFEKIVSIIFLIFAVGFNLWLYRLEPTAKVDPNDNLFQFALVYRTNQIWDYAQKMCASQKLQVLSLKVPNFGLCTLDFTLLADHWVPNWNEGYNLPFYYSHIPQIVIVGSWRFFHWVIGLLGYSFIGLFAYYHLVIYLLLCFFPLSVFLALLITGLSPLTAGFGALLASQISTDGFYGLDPSSFLWRGYGLSSQLFAMIWLPLAIAYAWRYFNEQTKIEDRKWKIDNLSSISYLLSSRSLWLAILFLVLTTSGHIGVGIMAFMSLIPLALAEPVMTFFRQKWNRDSWDRVKINIVKLTAISAVTIFLLSYWLIPAYLADNFHNFSFWDPVWKFNSYGAKEILARLGNGALFDFGRLPIFTALAIIGCFAAPEFALLFIFWLVLYFGRTTWGNIIDIIPTFKEIHLSRFIVGVHLAGLFLAPIGLEWIVLKVTGYGLRVKNLKSVRLFVYLVIGVLVVLSIYPQTIRYNDLNNTLILRANVNYAKQAPDMNLLVSTIQNLESTSPGRVFAGRGGGWGKEFKIAETNMTMYLGNFAIPTVLWLPETWSPNGDTEQYFREDHKEDYDLYNIKYVAAPPNLSKDQIQPFWKPLKRTSSWVLYEVSSSVPSVVEGSSSNPKQILRQAQDNRNMNSGYFSAGVRPAIVAADKYSRANVVRLWIQSDDPKNGLYPQLTFDTKKYPVNVGLPNFKMLDDVTFEIPDGSTHNVFAEPPRYISPISPTSPNSLINITSQSEDTDMIFKATVEVKKDCTECLVILKQTYSPNWRVTVDGSPITPIITFPFYIGIPVSEGLPAQAGTHTIVASYEPSKMKVILLILTGISLVIGFTFRKRIRS